MSGRKSGSGKDAFEKLDDFFRQKKASIKKALKKGKKLANEEPSDKMSWPPDDIAARRNLKDD